MDFRKTFEENNYQKYLAKVHPVFENEAAWDTEDFVSGRKQFVCIDSNFFSVHSVDSEVPHGFVLGTLHFFKRVSK